jgi:hypothetical protein
MPLTNADINKLMDEVWASAPPAVRLMVDRLVEADRKDSKPMSESKKHQRDCHERQCKDLLDLLRHVWSLSLDRRRKLDRWEAVGRDVDDMLRVIRNNYNNYNNLPVESEIDTLRGRLSSLINPVDEAGGDQ